MANYGTSQHCHLRHNDSATADTENATLLSKPKTGSATTRAQQHLTAKLDRTRTDLILLVCYVVTGLLDSSAIFIYGCFVSMQTGNTIYLGLGLFEPDAGNRWIRSAASIFAFCAGSWFFGWLHRKFVPTKRWVLMASYFLQLLLILGAALIVTFGPKVTKEGPVTAWVIVPLCLIAFQAAGQGVTSRALQFDGVTSVVLTSTYIDLFSDPGILTDGLRENPERNRRAVAPVLLLLGSFFGGYFAHSRIGLAGALWTAIAVKAIVVLAWFVWPVEKEHDES